MQRSFSSRALALPIVLALAQLAGCGSSKHAATSTRTSNPTAPLIATATAPTASGPKPTTTARSSVTTKTPATKTPATKTTTTSNPTGGAGLPSGQSSSTSGGSTNARVPATFTIASGGQLSPASVSAPAFLAVQLTIVSRDGKSHQVLLRTPTPHSLSVPAHGHASMLIPGLRAGHYPLEIDGAPRGALSIGGEPGP